MYVCMYVCMYEYTYAYVSSKKGAYLEFHRTDRSYELHNDLKSEKKLQFNEARLIAIKG